MAAIRITPAYAGKSTDCSPTFFWHQDHPRLCGEKTLSQLCTGKIPGSPPPMRGKGSSSSFSLIRSRITPAYAGKSS